MALNDVQIRYTGDESDALKSIAKIEKQIDKLERRKIKFNTDTAQAKRFNATIDDIDSKLGKLDGKKLNINADTKQLSQAETQLLRIEATQKRLQSQVAKGASDSTILGSRATLSNQMKQLDRINSLDLSRPFTNASNALRAVSDQTGALADKFLRLGKTIALVGTGLAAGLVASAKSAISFLGEQQKGFNDTVILLGDNEAEARKLAKTLNEFDIKSPFAISQLNQLANVLAVSIPNADELGKKVKELADASGGSFESASRAAITLQQVFSKGFLDKRDFIELSSSMPAVAKELLKIGAATDGAKTSIDDVNKALANATQGFKRTETAARTIPGLISSISSVFQKFTASAFGVDLSEGFRAQAGGLFDTISNIVSSIVDNPRIQSSALKFGDSISSTISKALGGVNGEDVSNKIADILDRLAKEAPATIDNLIKKAKKLYYWIDKIMAIVHRLLETIGSGDSGQGLERLTTGILVAGPAIKGISMLTSGLSGMASILATLTSVAPGATSALSGLSGVLGAIGSALLSIPALITGVVLGLSILGGGFDSLKENISGILGGISGFASSLGSILGGVMSGNTDQISQGIVDAFSNLGSIQGTIQQLLFDIMTSAFKGAIELFKNTNPTIVLIRAIFDSNFRDKLIEIGKTVISTAFEAIGGYIKGYITGLFGEETTGDAKSKLSEFISSVVGFFTSIPGKISKAIEELKTKVATTWENIKQTSSEFVTNVKEKVLTFFEELPYKIGFAIGSIVQWFKDLPGNILEAVSNLSTTITTKFTEWWTWLQTNVPIWFTNVVTWFTELPGKLLGALAILVQTIKDKFQEWWNWLATNVPIWISNIVTWFTELPGKIITAIGNIADAFANWISGALNIGKTIADNIISGLGNIRDRIADVIGNIWDKVTSGFNDAQGHAMGGVIYRADGGSIPKVVYASRGKAIQQFKPRGTDTVPAMLTPGEFVVKKSSVRRFGLDTMRQINNGNIEGTIKRLLQRPGAGVLGSRTSNTTSQTVNNSQNNSRSINAPITVNNYSQASERNSFFNLAGYIGNGIG